MKADIACIYNRCHWAIRKDLDHAPLQMDDFGEYKKDEYEDTQQRLKEIKYVRTRTKGFELQCMYAIKERAELQIMYDPDYHGEAQVKMFMGLTTYQYRLARHTYTIFKDYPRAMLHLEAVNLAEIHDLTTNDAMEIRKNLVADFQQHIEDSQEKEDELEPRDYDPEDDYWYHADTLPPTYEE